jgi:hypothetical protein
MTEGKRAAVCVALLGSRAALARAPTGLQDKGFEAKK